MWLLHQLRRLGVNFTVQGRPDFEDATEIRLSGTKVVGTRQAAIPSLTNSTAGAAADGTLEAMADIAGVAAVLGDAATRADVNAKLAQIRNNFTEISAKQDAILAALRAHGLIAP